MKRETKRKQSLQRKRRAKLNKKTKRKNKIKQSKKPKKNIKKKSRKTKKGGRPTPSSNRQISDNEPPLTHIVTDRVNEEWEPSVSSEEAPTVIDESFDTFESFSDIDSEDNSQMNANLLLFLITFLDQPSYEEEIKETIKRFPDHLQGVLEEDTLRIVMSNQRTPSDVRDAGNKLKRVIEMYIDEKIPSMEQNERVEYVEKIIRPISIEAAARMLDFSQVPITS